MLAVSSPVPLPSAARRLAVALAILVPLFVDPHGDTLALKKLSLGILGSLALAFEAAEVFLLRRRAMAPSVAEGMLAGLALWGACSLSWAVNPALGLVGVGVLFGMLGVTRGVRQSLFGNRRVSSWVAAVLAVGLVALVVDGVAVVREGMSLQLAARKHASWLFGHNNMAANYAAVLAPLAAAFAMTAEGRGRRVGGWLLVVVVVGYQVLLHSRAGLASTLLGVGLAGVLFVVRARVRRPGRRAAALLGAFCIAAALLPSSDRARGLAKEAFFRGVSLLEELKIADLADASFRPGVYRRTMELVAEAPLLGAGLGNFPVAYSRFDPRAVEIPHAHNDALQILAELGLVGLLMFFGLLSALVWQVLLGLSSREADLARDRRKSVWAAGLGGAVVVFLVGGLFEVPFALGDTACNLALLIALSGRLAAEPRAWSKEAPGDGFGVVRLVAVLALLPLLLLAGFLAARMPASSLFARAQRAREVGNLEEARRHLTRLAELNTGMHVPDLQLGQLAEQAGDWQTALEHFQSARRLWPHSLRLLELEAEALMQLGRNDEAVAICEQAAALAPGDRAMQARLVLLLAQAGRLTEALDQATYLLQSHPTASTEIVAFLARLHQRQSKDLDGQARVEALVASRHFYAVLLQDGSPGAFHEWNSEFRHLTHQLQSLPGAPGSWWGVYERFRSGGGWQLPNVALWTAVDGTGEEIFPGWDEAAGPPLPRRLR